MSSESVIFNQNNLSNGENPPNNENLPNEENPPNEINKITNETQLSTNDVNEETQSQSQSSIFDKINDENPETSND
jgi:hypothetical protein